jgi:CRP-like cAMP-binding protein/Fe-S-cluster-containing hydrogenase component 2
MSPDKNMPLGQTQIKRLEQYKDRWTSYGANTGIVEISERPTPAMLKRFEIFQEYDDNFLEKISPDVSIAKWKKSTVLFEEGNYVDVAFFIASGSVDVYLKKTGGASAANPIFDRSRTVISSNAQSAGSGQAPAGGQTFFQAQVGKQERSGTQIAFLSAIDFNLPIGGSKTLEAGDIFGEIGALSGWPQSVTARTTSECQLVQIRSAAIRKMRKRSKTWAARLDKVYRDEALLSQLKVTPLFRGLGDDFLQALAAKMELVSCEPDETVIREGDPPDALYMVRSGFVKLSQKYGEGNIVVSYLSKGSTLGEIELLLEGSAGWLYTASSKEYSELIKISREEFVQLVGEYPNVEKLLWQSAVARIKESGYARRNIRQSEFINTALDKGLVEGNSILVIDLNVCTRCDDCVRGCASTHGDIPRFVREGDRVGDFLVTRACYHCQDPVCLIGCPTGAIRRAAVGDVVEIDEKLCIGCKTCANKCPYDAIIMYETGETWPGDMIPEGLRGKEQQIATKCDLCYTDPAGPACVRSCPHGCAFRVGTLDEFQQLLWKA